MARRITRLDNRRVKISDDREKIHLKSDLEEEKTRLQAKIAEIDTFLAVF